VGAARMLIEAGAEVQTANKQGLLAIDLSKLCERQDMHVALQRSP